MDYRIALCFICSACSFLSSDVVSAGTGSVEIIVRGEDGKPLPCRIHLKDADGKPLRADPLPFWRDHFVCPGTVRLEHAAGNYSYEIERGPEYVRQNGSLTITEGETHTLRVALKRLANLSAEGWWSGELHVHRPIEDVELLMRAEDLHVAPVITWWNNRNRWRDRALPANRVVRFDGNRYYDLMAGEDEREGGALMYFGLSKPLDIAGSSREYPPPLKFVTEARQPPLGARQHGDVWIDVEKPFWWDVPTWLASGQVDSIGLANNHMCRDRMYESEAWGKPRDAERLPAPRGNGYWSQEIYYRLLNCSLRIPPSAGSASGVLPNPVGYNRVYVHLGPDFTYEKWWQGLRAGRSFVTNGPLLRCRADGKLPGHVFTADEGEELDVELKLELATQDHIPAIEVIKNGRVERSVPWDQWAKTGSLGSVHFKGSGWFLVRAITDNEQTFRFASTAPYYVEIGPARRRISKSSVQFFLDWVRERMQRIKLDDPEQRREVLQYHEQAERFWEALLAKATAE